jgi:transposase
LIRRRKKKGSHDDWTQPDDPDAKITKMKDGRTHLAHKAGRAVDADSSAIVAVTVQGADVGDTSSVVETVVEAAEQLERVDAPAQLDELIADKGYHANRTLICTRSVSVPTSRSRTAIVAAGIVCPMRKRSSTQIADALDRYWRG